MDESASNSSLYIFKLLLFVFSCVISVISFEDFYYRYNAPKWAVFDLFCILLFIFSIYFSPRVRVNFISTIIGLLTLYMLMTLLWSPNKFEGVLFVFRFLAFALSIFIVVSIVPKCKLVEILTDSVFYSSIIFCAVIIYERYWLALPYTSQSFSPIGFVNYLGHVLNIWIPVLVLSIYNRRNSTVFLLLGLASLLVLMNLLVESLIRGTILGLLVAEIIVLFAVLLKTKKFQFKYLSILVAFSCTLVTFNLIENSGLSTLRGEITSIQEMDTGRETIFSNTIDMVKDNPLGVGVNNFEYIHQKYARAGTPDASPYISNMKVLRTPYNIVLKFYSELGFLGGSLFLILFSMVVIRAFLNFLKGGFVDAWIFIAVFALCFHAMFSSVFLTPVSLFFSIPLFAVVFSRESLNGIQPMNMRWIWIIVPFVFLLACLSIAKITSANLTAKGYRMGNTELVEKSLELNPYDYFTSLRLYSLYLIKEGNKEQALQSLERAINLYPYNIYMLIKAGDVASQLGLNDKAEEYKKRALDIYPNYYQAKLINKGA
ncbi:DUF5957 family protein [Pseudoalteromonas luteoviolacea]|nr:O-antigen ligase family protein [Pseudoalteromonas luteoviolacea]